MTGARPTNNIGSRLGDLIGWLLQRLGIETRNAVEGKIDVGSLAPAALEMLGHMESLAPVAAAVEKRFLEITSGLEDMTRTSCELRGDTDALIRLATGGASGKNAVQSAIDFLDSPLAFLDGYHRESSALNGRLEAFHTKIASMLAIEQTFHRTMEPLKYVQTLFRVEAAACESRVQEMFLGLVQDIERMHGQVHGTFSDQVAKLHHTRKTLKAVITGLATSIARQQGVTIARRASIDASLQKLRSHVEKHRSIDADLGRVSREISDETGRVVMALQFQDIISQKLQHVREAVLAMEESRRRAMTTGDPIALGKELRFIEQAGRIVVGQIARVETELVQAEESIVGGVRSILRLMEELDHACEALTKLDTATARADGLAQRILDAFEEVRGLTRESVDSAGHAHAEIRPVGDMASNVTDLLRQLSRDMHLIGLNAEIQAAQVSTGTGLEVISSKTSEISMETNELSNRVALDLETLQRGLIEVIETLGRFHREGVNHSTTLDCEFPRTSAALHQHRDSSIQALSRVSGLVQKLGQQARPMLETARFDGIAGDVLPALLASVEQVSQHAGRLADQLGAGKDVTERTDEFVGRYTMSSEREVHMAAVPDRTGGAPVPPATVDSLGFGAGDLDLFDPLPAPATEPALQASSAPAEDMGFDLWIDDAPQAIPSGAVEVVEASGARTHPVD